ncbi:Nitrogen assimilation transcription factor nirA [Madurella mycetomatis]|uniref:Nitrogen assimilation transcription factor nirA n=1 Tax=Madurella mycetomatis TaxID=100816 RepID=A0A175VS25_9PEZI|nr:Nitrogen assimilation transcription factor nirA [Madurella mycetomatis]
MPEKEDEATANCENHTQCDGTRPTCGACAKRNEGECKYPVREGAISRYADLKETSEFRDRENRDLRELFARLHSRPEAEAFEILRRLRATSDPFEVLRCLRGADTLLAIPSPNGFPTAGREMMKLEDATFAASAIKVPARPWTTVAGDGLVSNLISAFFRWDDPFIYSFVERELFLRDMRHGQGPYCSPLLVNAICALRSMLSDKVRLASGVAGTNLREAFMSEVKHHLELEAGKMTLTTVQGLYMLYMVTCHDGTNRAGTMYRLAALDMLGRLKPDKAFARWSHQMPEEADKRRAFSKTCWGIFNFECLLSHLYIKPSAMSPPTMPVLHGQDATNGPIIDIFGAPFGPASPEPPIVPGTPSAMSQISVLQHAVMTYNASPQVVVGRDDDMQTRRDYLIKLAALENSLPPRLRYRENLTPQTIFIKVYLNAVAYNIVRPLHLTTIVHGNYTAKSIMMELAVLDVHLTESL